MSEARVTRWRLVAIALSLCAWHAAGAQTVAEYRRQADSLGREWRTAIVANARSDSAQVRTIPGDTVRVGHLLALSDSAHVSLARATLTRLGPALDSAFGASVRELTMRPFVIHTNPRDTAVAVTGIIDTAGVIRLLSSDYPTEPALANSWHNKVDAVMTTLTPFDLQKWLLATIPTGAPTESDWTNDRIQLVLADSRVSHACFRGDLAACLKAFSLVPVADPAFELYDETEQRAILNAHGYLLRQSDPATYDACMTEDVRTACTALLRSMPADAIPQPVPPNLRASLVRYALAVGGVGAFDRLVGTPGTPRQQIEAAARLPVDTLIAHWRAMALNTKGGSNAIDLETALASLAWAGLFVGLSLRSSRWR